MELGRTIRQKVLDWLTKDLVIQCSRLNILQTIVDSGVTIVSGGKIQKIASASLPTGAGNEATSLSCSLPLRNFYLIEIVCEAGSISGQNYLELYSGYPHYWSILQITSTLSSSSSSSTLGGLLDYSASSNERQYYIFYNNIQYAGRSCISIGLDKGVGTVTGNISFFHVETNVQTSSITLKSSATNGLAPGTSIRVYGLD